MLVEEENWDRLDLETVVSCAAAKDSSCVLGRMAGERIDGSDRPKKERKRECLPGSRSSAPVAHVSACPTTTVPVPNHL